MHRGLLVLLLVVAAALPAATAQDFKICPESTHWLKIQTPRALMLLGETFARIAAHLNRTRSVRRTPQMLASNFGYPRQGDGKMPPCS